MKKSTSILLKILLVCLIIGAIECFIFASLYNEAPDECERLSGINISEIHEHTTIYCEELEVVKRYAFKTVHEYSDSEGSYTDTTYYVYDDSQPMDKNELFAQYYIVKFCDKSGKEFITSLSVSADKDLSAALAKTPLKISACVGVAPISNNSLLNTHDEQLRQLRETSLDAYSQDSQISRAQVTFGYQTESIAQYQSDFERDVNQAKVTAAVFGVALIVAGIFLVRFIHKNARKSEDSQ